MLAAQREAVQRVRAEMAKPDTDQDFAHSDAFDPWELFPALYGAYSKSFDDCAIEVLEGLASDPKDWSRDDLGAQMFREMLCTSNLCDYGTSPRACFPTQEFAGVLPELIARWKAYRDRVWK